MPSAIGRAESSAEQLITSIQADYVTLQRARSELQGMLDAGRLSPAANDEYRNWIVNLQEKIVRGCQQLRRTGSESRQPLECKAPVRSPSAASIDTRLEQTRAEQTATLQQELDQSIGEFDEKLLREQQRVKAATPATGSTRSASTGQPGEAGADASTATGVPSEKTDNTGDDSDRETTTTTRSTPVDGSKGRPGGYDAPPDIPDGSDDDVVARQIREAAEQETNPELRKKLWEEYRRYKAGIR